MVINPVFQYNRIQSVFLHAFPMDSNTPIRFKSRDYQTGLINPAETYTDALRPDRQIPRKPKYILIQSQVMAGHLSPD